MTEEAYVSFETAKLLRKKGFTEPTYWAYHIFDDGYLDLRSYNFPLGNIDLDNSEYAAPTQQMAMRWLRETHKLSVESVWCSDKGVWWGRVVPIDSNPDEELEQKALGFDYPGLSYEDACETGIKYCLLNLI